MQAGDMKNAFIAALSALVLAVTGAMAAEKGPVTNLPLPRYVSLKSGEGNARRGPSLTHRVDWVFRHEDMPLLVTGEYGHWRRVQDMEGQGGWMHYSLLSGVRTVVFLRDKTQLFIQPTATSATRAVAERGAIAKLEECNLDWCKVASGGIGGWVRKDQVWGVEPDEIRE